MGQEKTLPVYENILLCTDISTVNNFAYIAYINNLIFSMISLLSIPLQLLPVIVQTEYQLLPDIYLMPDYLNS